MLSKRLRTIVNASYPIIWAASTENRIYRKQWPAHAVCTSMFPLVYEINFSGWFHLLYFGVLIPAAAINHAKKFHDNQRPMPNRLQRMQRTVFGLVMFGTISILVARREWMTLFPGTIPSWQSILAGAGMLALGIGLMRPRWRRAVERRVRVVHLFMPANITERLWWIAVAVLAGISEEITWRGVQTALLRKLTGSVLLAIALSATSFAVAHIIQGWKSVIVVAMFALSFHFLVWLSGSLYVAMAVHMAYDVTAGISYGRLGRQLGYKLDPSPELAGPTGQS